jgi:hypothetical protein
VGIHIVGSAAFTPEMIWATFEHVNNTPDGTYAYTATATAGSPTTTVTKTVTQSTAGNWLFCSNNSTGPFNVPRITLETSTGDLLAAQSGGTIGPSDTLRVMAWGASINLTPNPTDPSSADSDSELVAINNTSHQLLASGDVRANYILTGATFSIIGDIPGPDSVPFPDTANPPVTDKVDESGTSQMANTTLETYQQAQNNSYSKFVNCFSCHQGNPLGDSGGTGLSHIYGQIKPLF